MRLSRMCRQVIALQVWSGLWAIIEAENAYNDLIEFIRDVQRASATPVSATWVFIILESSCEGGAHSGGCTSKHDPSPNRIRCHNGEVMFMCKLLNFRYIFGSCTLGRHILLSGERWAFLLDLFTDVVGQIACGGASQVDRNLNTFIRIHRTDGACVSQRLPLTTRKLLIPLGWCVSHALLLISCFS
jgi:hypothetical protein